MFSEVQELVFGDWWLLVLNLIALEFLVVFFFFFNIKLPRLSKFFSAKEETEL